MALRRTSGDNKFSARPETVGAEWCLNGRDLGAMNGADIGPPASSDATMRPNAVWAWRF
jgi:hypothetical protein